MRISFDKGKDCLCELYKSFHPREVQQHRDCMSLTGAQKDTHYPPKNLLHNIAQLLHFQSLKQDLFSHVLQSQEQRLSVQCSPPMMLLVQALSFHYTGVRNWAEPSREHNPPWSRQILGFVDICQLG